MTESPWGTYRDVCEGLAMFLGVGSGDEQTTAEEYYKRIQQGVLMCCESSLELAHKNRQALNLSQDSAISLQNTVDVLRDTIRDQEAIIRREITSDHVGRLQDALEGYCDGLAIEESTAKLILSYVFTGRIEDERQNYNCPCAHPSQCDNSCFEDYRKSSERAAAVKGEE